MEDKELRKQLLGSKKTERIIFAATPELKAALETVAGDRCVSVSALITTAVLNELAAEKELLEGVVE